jgi:hypothetical protein
MTIPPIPQQASFSSPSDVKPSILSTNWRDHKFTLIGAGVIGTISAVSALDEGVFSSPTRWAIVAALIALTSIAYIAFQLFSLPLVDEDDSSDSELPTEVPHSDAIRIEPDPASNAPPITTQINQPLSSFNSPVASKRKQEQSRNAQNLSRSNTKASSSGIKKRQRKLHFNEKIPKKDPIVSNKKSAEESHECLPPGSIVFDIIRNVFQTYISQPLLR